MGTRLDRRELLRVGGTTLALMGSGSLATFARALSAPSTSDRDPVLVVLFQRGAADGLHMVVPYRDRNYRGLRGALALDEPGRGERPTLDLGDGFALHPSLSPLFPLYSAGKLAFVVNVGSPDPTRSHFDAQDYMESGTPGRKATRDGWLSRALTAVEARGPFAAVALSASMPRSLAGAETAIAMEDFSRLGRSRGNTALEGRLEAMYLAEARPELAAMGKEAFEALRMFRELDPLSRKVPEGVRYPTGQRSEPFRQVAALLKAGLGVRVAFISTDGWDTHFGQGAATGQMANLLRRHASAIAALLEDVGTSRPVTLLSVTEFGRTVEINGAGGTDHGHGAVMMAAGAGVHGGRVVGDWLGLEREHLYEGRDLPVTMDFRDLFSEVAARTLALEQGVTLFPGYQASPVGVTRAL